MAEITINVPERLVNQVKATGVWFPNIMELGLSGFRTKTAEAVSDLVSFLEKSPSPQEVLDFYISDELQERLNYLLDVNREGEIEEIEKRELGEWIKFDHITIMLKAQAGNLSSKVDKCQDTFQRNCKTKLE